MGKKFVPSYCNIVHAVVMGYGKDVFDPPLNEHRDKVYDDCVKIIEDGYIPDVPEDDEYD